MCRQSSIFLPFSNAINQINNQLIMHFYPSMVYRQIDPIH